MSSINDIASKLRENKILRERAEYKEMSLNDVIARCQSGDRLAFEYLLKQYGPLINKLSSKYVMDTQDRDDILQIASIGFWDAVLSWDPAHNQEGGFVNHVTLIVNRKLTDELRKDSTGKTKIHTTASSTDDTIASDGEGGDMTLGDTLSSKDLNPEDDYLGREGSRELMKFMKDNLTGTELRAIRMYIQGYKVSEIAEETGMKYKSVDNAINRVKGKISQWQKTRESKKLKEQSAVEFTDEEKKVLSSILDKIDEQKSLNETVLNKIRESYENYTEEQLTSELEDIESDIDEIADRMPYIEDDERTDALNALDDIKAKLYAMEEYLTDSQYKKSEDLMLAVNRAEDIEYRGEPDDHYEYDKSDRYDYFDD